MLLSQGHAKKQKWMMKRTKKDDYRYFAFSTEMKVDAFLDTVTQEEKNQWYPELHKQQKKTEECGGTGRWYFVFSGPKCGLYNNYESFIAARDEDYVTGVNYNSKKATRFDTLGEAKSWIQGSRDEEGVHWGWPNPMPVVFDGAE